MKRYEGRVYSREGRPIGDRHVLYSRERDVYLHYSGRGESETRYGAWSGTRVQGMNCISVYKVPPDFRLYLDGKEKDQ